MTTKNLPIGVFDSGVGGLTVLHALKKELPNESFIYLGDTARLPYGTKSQDTVKEYARIACNTLNNFGIKALVVACNTASALALDYLKESFPHLPIIGVLEPGSIAASKATHNGKILVIATEATIQAEKGYSYLINKQRPNTEVVSKACNLFVALVEEGLIEGNIPESVITYYLSDFFKNENPPDSLVLGCTHFPILHESIKKVVPNYVSIIDSAKTAANTVKIYLEKESLLSNLPTQETRFFVTDSPNRFKKIAKQFLVETTIDLEHLDLPSQIY